MPIKPFGERLGFKPPRKDLQLNEVSRELRASLWNALFEFNLFDAPHIEQFSQEVWIDLFKEAVDQRPIAFGYHGAVYIKVVERFRNVCFKGEWVDVYEFVEFAVKYLRYAEVLIARLNEILEREGSGYRFVNGMLAPITNETELEEVGLAASDTAFPGAAAHLSRAAELMSDRKNPDYRNSIKESISAVESCVRKITGDEKATLGVLLKVLEKQHPIHAALREAFDKLYGYASDEQGIRHAMLDETNLTQADARYFLVTCSAFVNYLKQLTIK